MLSNEVHLKIDFWPFIFASDIIRSKKMRNNWAISFESVTKVVTVTVYTELTTGI